MLLMCAAEFALWTVLGLLFWSKMLHRQYPAMGIYLVLHVASLPVLLFFLCGQARHWFNDYCDLFYFYSFWAVYIAGAVLFFFICLQLFRAALSAFSGLQRFGPMAFRWAVFVSTFASLSTLSLQHGRTLFIPVIAYELMRSVSILEICMLAFLSLSMKALRIPVRSMTFGIVLGFGVMSTTDLMYSSLFALNTSLTSPMQFVFESLILVALGVWIAYCALPESARLPKPRSGHFSHAWVGMQYPSALSTCLAMSSPDISNQR